MPHQRPRYRISNLAHKLARLMGPSQIWDRGRSLVRHARTDVKSSRVPTQPPPLVPVVSTGTQSQRAEFGGWH